MTKEEIKQKWIDECNRACDLAMSRLNFLNEEAKTNTIEYNKEYRLVIPWSLVESKQITITGRELLDLVAMKYKNGL